MDVPACRTTGCTSSTQTAGLSTYHTSHCQQVCADVHWGLPRQMQTTPACLTLSSALAGELNEVIAPSCYSCFDYTNSLADMVRSLLCARPDPRPSPVELSLLGSNAHVCDGWWSLQVVGYMGVPYESTDMTSHPQAGYSFIACQISPYDHAPVQYASTCAFTSAEAANNSTCCPCTVCDSSQRAGASDAGPCAATPHRDTHISVGRPEAVCAADRAIRR